MTDTANSSNTSILTPIEQTQLNGQITIGQQNGKLNLDKCYWYLLKQSWTGKDYKYLLSMEYPGDVPSPK